MLEHEIIIKDADIFLSGVALSNIYINKDHLLAVGRDVKDSKKIIQKRLNDKTKIRLNIDKEIWSTEIKNIDQFNEFSKSHSAYHLITKREYLAICYLDECRFDNNVIKKDKLNILKAIKNDIQAIYGLDDFKIEDIEMKFYEYGNVIITGRVKIRGKNLRIDDYKKISDFAHAYFGPALKEKVCELINIYIDVMKEIDLDHDIELNLLRVPLEIESIEDNRYNFIMNNSLNFAIRYHFIYHNELKNDNDFANKLIKILSGEWELNLKNTIILRDASAYFGWTHSLFVLKDYEEQISEKLYEKYKLPLEVVTANWGALDLLSKSLDKARAMFIREIEKIEKTTFRKKNFVKIANDIREFALKIERIMESFDSYTVSNNPMHYKLIDLQQEVFLEHKSIERIKKKLELVSKIVDELSIRQKNLEAENLSKALFAITLINIFDVSKVIFEIVNSNFNTQVTIIGVFLTLFLLVMFIYFKGSRN